MKIDHFHINHKELKERAMKKHGLKWVWMAVLSLCLSACGDDQATIEGILEDGKGVPVAGMKIIASQMQPVEGYDHLETITKADGTFRMSGLFRCSIYILKAWSETSTANAPLTIISGQPGQTSVLPQPMIIRFTAFADGVIFDSQANLDWLVGPNRDISFEQAEKWVAGQSTTAGGGWKMPTQDELSMLYQQGVGKRNVDPLFKTTGWWAWAGEFDPSSACRLGFSFGKGEKNWNLKDNSRDGRVFAVRSHLKR
ncbi:MAG: hypothetical protein V2B19_15125 [Pseudomonadota bacterium]